ncbi:hypothetical protein C2I36_13385 [Rhodobacteraceae bacterium WD3A24]|nr:hypothetical protein C2I36_13385 [Rhodobacteraceae bacterium WD3A24]
MDQSNDKMDLSGKLLIAMPGMPDPRFDRSVVFICAHSQDGAMGLIVNKPAPSEINFEDLLEQLSITPTDAAREIRVQFGGPVETGRGFVLHSADYSANSSTLEVDAQFGMTATLDILEDIAQGRGPGRSILALGYAGWGPGQLEQELVDNGWLTCDPALDLVFDSDNGGKWERAVKSIGIDPIMLSSSGGRA